MPRRRLFHAVYMFLALSAAPLFARAANAPPAPEAPLVTRARDLGIAQSLGWQRLLHIRFTAWGNAMSEIDGTSFFLAPRGFRDPEAELDATLRAFALPVVPGREDAHARCRFPARRRFLDERLHFEASLPPLKCPALARYLAAVDIDTVSVVYASNYLGNPASTFGHTFLRLKGQRAQVDFGLDYQAQTDTKNPFLYAFKGLSGLFPGTFQFHPFEDKRHEYADEEGRDLWEYRLALTADEAKLLALHLWELRTTYIDYYYMTKNCSYHVLATLEAAAPRIDVIAHLNAVVLPKDTIKAVNDVPGLVQDVAYQPSRQSRARGQIAPPVDKAPQRGHKSMRLTFGTGTTTQYGNGFTTLGYRLALHDLADSPEGEPELIDLQFVDIRFRYDLARTHLTLDNLTFAELLALNPITKYETPLSWKARGFGMRLHDRDCLDCFAHGLDFGAGATFATANEHLALFVMADAYVAFASELDGIGGSFVRLGIGPYAGLRARLPGNTIGLVTGSWSYLPGETLHGTYDVRATLRTTLARDVALGFEGAAQPRSLEGVLSSYLYF